MKRCQWTGSDDIMIAYHDTEWGVPLYDDQKLFEFLCLEGAQAGLSWRTILHRRTGYLKAFDNFDPNKIARYNQKKVEMLLKDERIIRNRLKIKAFIENARAFLRVQKDMGSFSTYLWSFVDGEPIVNEFKNQKELPSQSAISVEMSADLKKRGFKFVGPTICYAFMQATGMVNDHTMDCFRWAELAY
ncbi:MAG: DNA-3-methyladenine glycosylase I [Methanobacteriota archaeon]|nr:MAG: DNA-3-methyladenine glycosylase I [Euryarchaeota archaeon]